jgi:hypothetical protein
VNVLFVKAFNQSHILQKILQKELLVILTGSILKFVCGGFQNQGGEIGGANTVEKQQTVKIAGEKTFVNMINNAKCVKSVLNHTIVNMGGKNKTVKIVEAQVFVNIIFKKPLV